MGEGGSERLKREQRMGTGVRPFRGSNVQAFPPKNNPQSLKTCESKLVTTILGEQGSTLIPVERASYPCSAATTLTRGKQCQVFTTRMPQNERGGRLVCRLPDS